MDSNSDAYINFGFSGTKFIRINASGDTALFHGRHDSGVIMSLNAYGSGATALELLANTSGSGFALKSTGDTVLRSRYSSELVTVSGLALAYGHGTSFSGPYNADISLSTAWVDFLVTTGNVVLPAASTCPGKIIFIRNSSTSYTITSSSTIYSGSSGIVTNAALGRIGSFFFISNGSAWYAFNCYYSS